ncbi:helix-turn-helix transcriptional regulator [bacterium]|nr:helix-turn-helix transcriptional regulator [bacterium]
MDNLGTRIQEQRKQHKFSQVELGQKIGVSKSQINRYENKEVQPPADILNKIADLFGTSVDFLINGLSAEKAQATLKNAELLQQFKQVEELPKEEQSTIIKFVGAYLRDFQTKKAYAS